MSETDSVEVIADPFDFKALDRNGEGAADSSVALCLHGLTGTPYEVRPLGEAIAAVGIDAFGPALPGHNETPEALSRVPYSDWLDATSSHYEALRERYARVFVVGLSMGGPITAQFANQHPGKVKRLVLIDPMVFLPSEEDISFVNLPAIGEYMTNVYLIPQLAAGQTGDFQDKDRFPEWESRFREQMQYQGFRRAILSTVREWFDADILGEYEKLGKSGTPVQLFWGHEDQTVPLKFSNKLLELVPQARLTVIDNAGHIPHFELPAIFNPLLLKYLQAPLDP